MRDERQSGRQMARSGPRLELQPLERGLWRVVQFDGRALFPAVVEAGLSRARAEAFAARWARIVGLPLVAGEPNRKQLNPWFGDGLRKFG